MQVETEAVKHETASLDVDKMILAEASIESPHLKEEEVVKPTKLPKTIAPLDLGKLMVDVDAEKEASVEDEPSEERPKSLINVTAYFDDSFQVLFCYNAQLECLCLINTH